MKKFVLLSALVMALNAQAANNTLMTLKKSPGFTPHPQWMSITVLENGSVVKVVKTTKDSTKEVLAKLSERAIESIKNKIAEIDDNAVLVDPAPKAPKCTDAPSSSVSVNKGGKEIDLKRKASCHVSQVESLEAQDLIEIVTGFEKL